MELATALKSARRSYPIPSSLAVTAVMRANRKRDSGPEVALRRELHRRGMRYRKNLPMVAGGVRFEADIVFARARVAVFVDGCFWHGCPVHGVKPKVNVQYWLPKLRRNQDRDAAVNSALRGSGWRVLRVWEHVPVEEGASAVEEAVKSATTGLSSCDGLPAPIWSAPKVPP